MALDRGFPSPQNLRAWAKTYTPSRVVDGSNLHARAADVLWGMAWMSRKKGIVHLPAGQENGLMDLAQELDDAGYAMRAKYGAPFTRVQIKARALAE